MTDQTLFGRNIASLVKKSQPKKDKESSGCVKLPVEVHARLLDDVSSFERLLLCSVANSTALLPSGEKARYALGFGEINRERNRTALAFHLRFSDEEERERVALLCREEYDRLRSILEGTHDDLLELIGEGGAVAHFVRIVDWEEKAKQYLPGNVSIGWYYQHLHSLDRDILEKAETDSLTFAFLEEADEKGSFLARNVIEKGFKECYESIDRLVLQERKLVVLEHGDRKNQRPIFVVGISKNYIGGNKDDAGASTIRELIQESIDEADFGGYRLSSGSPIIPLDGPRIRFFYRAIGFLQKQGYVDDANRLQESMRDTLYHQFEKFFEHTLNDYSDFHKFHHLLTCMSLARDCDEEIYAEWIQEIKENETEISDLVKRIVTVNYSAEARVTEEESEEAKKLVAEFERIIADD